MIIIENRQVSEEEARKTASVVGLSALKYGDLSNQATKNYVFDIERFASFEGNTGPYILYTIVRIKSIIEKYGKDKAEEISNKSAILPPEGKSEKELMLELTKFGIVVEGAFEELAPHRICNYIYELSNTFNAFYHDTKILSQENEEKRSSYINLLMLTKKILEQCIALLGFEAPERM
jgi:arginyl-tRNA synthetase